LDLTSKKVFLDKQNKELSLNMQCDFLNINKSSLYYEKTPLIERIGSNIIAQIIEIYKEIPFYGVRRTYHELSRRGYEIGRDRVGKIRKQLRLRTLYPAPKTTYRNKRHDIYQYLLKNLKITRVNQVWATDITYIPIKGGFAYLTSIIDIYSRKILAWNLSNTMHRQNCIDALNEALERYELPEIFNSDQGSQFTSEEFTGILLTNNIAISMDSKGRALDNIFIERFWRTLKYEDIYLNNYETLLEARIGINKFINFYNTKRLHSSLNYQTPDEIYYNIITDNNMSVNTIKDEVLV
jgi:putative transposase